MSGMHVAELELCPDGVIRETITGDTWTPGEIFEKLTPTDMMEIGGMMYAVVSTRDGEMDYLIGPDVQALVMEQAQKDEPEIFNRMLEKVEKEYGIKISDFKGILGE